MKSITTSKNADEIINDLISRTEAHIRKALSDYAKHTTLTGTLDDISDAFIYRLSRDSVESKKSLRALFSKSPAWDESIQAIVINGTRTHDPDAALVYSRAYDILYRADGLSQRGISAICDFFAYPENAPIREAAIRVMSEVAPQAYAPNKKPSRVFRSLCRSVGVADETAGSNFQRQYALLADELSAKKIEFKLFVSISPAHFLTMSNPKYDSRGSTLTSCHSLNSTEYKYNVGCSGYARDGVSFIAFTAADPDSPETLNNRKVTRQVFAYAPGGGVLLQSRLYNTSGGTTGAQKESRIYRDLIQREISALEGAANLWHTCDYYNGGREHLVSVGLGFGGYPDWEYEGFGGKVSVRDDCGERPETIYVGTYGLCVVCGEEIEENLYCESCDPDGGYRCEMCNCRYESGDLVRAYSDGQEIWVCEPCLNDEFNRCSMCDEYHHHEDTRCIDSREAYLCPGCFERHGASCRNCYIDCYEDDMVPITGPSGESFLVCQDCADDYPECPDCCERYEGDVCPTCGQVIGEEAAV